MVSEAKTIHQTASLVFEAFRGVLSFRCNVLINIRVRQAEIEMEGERLLSVAMPLVLLTCPESRQPISKLPVLLQLTINTRQALCQES